MTNNQMELGLGGEQIGTGIVGTPRRETRIKRAAWWFGRMRQLVDGAMDWHAESAGRPEQTWLPGAQRQVQL